MCEWPPRSPQRAQSHLDSQVDTNSFCFSHQYWESSSSRIHNQQASWEPSAKAPAQLAEAPSGFSRGTSAPRPAAALPHRGRERSSVSAPQRGRADAEWAPGSHQSPGVSPDSCSNCNVLDDNDGPPTRRLPSPPPGGDNDAEDGSSFFPGEDASGAARPLQRCLDGTGDISSSDDEGKLIIEL